MIGGAAAKATLWQDGLRGTRRRVRRQNNLLKAATLTLLILCAATLPACGMPAPYSIEDIQNIIVAGIDLHEDKIILTVLVDTMQKGTEAGSVQTGTEIYIAEGETVFDAKRTLHQMTEKHITWDQLKFIIIGENAARQGIDRILTFFVENEENKFLHELLIVKANTAAAFIQQTSSEETSLSDTLFALTEEASQTGRSAKTTLLEYAISKERPWTALWIPTITKAPNLVTQNQENERANIVDRSGFALFYEDKLAGYLENDAARALAFVLDEIESTSIIVKDQDDQNVSLEVIKSHTAIKPTYEPLSAVIEINVQSNIVEYFKEDILSDDKYVFSLEQKQSALIQQEVEDMINTIQQSCVDVIALGDAFYHKDPKEWQKIKDNWNNLFRTIPVTVKVISTIQCSYNLQNAL